MPRHDVFIFKDEEKGEFRVRPAVVVKEKSTKEKSTDLKVRNFSDHTATVTFENGGARPGTLAIGSRKGDKFQVGSTPGVYEYKVMVETPGGPVEAVGESGPKMIIDD
jgi:hypothetical protein